MKIFGGTHCVFAVKHAESVANVDSDCFANLRDNMKYPLGNHHMLRVRRLWATNNGVRNNVSSCYTTLPNASILQQAEVKTMHLLTVQSIPEYLFGKAQYRTKMRTLYTCASA